MHWQQRNGCRSQSLCPLPQRRIGCIKSWLEMLLMHVAISFALVFVNKCIGIGGGGIMLGNKHHRQLSINNFREFVPAAGNVSAYTNVMRS
jgi:hypothetical protein